MGGREKTSPEGVCLCCCLRKKKLYEEKRLKQKKDTEQEKNEMWGWSITWTAY